MPACGKSASSAGHAPARRLIAAVLATLMAALPLGSYARAQAAITAVTLWTWSPGPGTVSKMIAAFEAAHPAIQVDYTNFTFAPQYRRALAAAARAGKLPDLIGVQPGALTQLYRSHLIPLQTYAAKTWGSNWRSKFYTVDVNQLTLGNPAGDHNVYDLPEESQIVNVWYNTQLFQLLHLPRPTTYQRLVRISRRLRARGIPPLFQGAADAWQNENLFLMLASQLAPGQVYRAEAGTVPWTSPGLVKAMSAWKRLFTGGIIQAGALHAHVYPDGVSLFTAGRAGMMALGSWWLQEYRMLPPRPPLVEDWDFGTFFLPAVPGSNRPSAPVGGVDVALGMTRNARHRAAAWQVIQSWIAGEAEQAALNDLSDLPAYKGLAPTIQLPAAIVTQYQSYLGELDQAQSGRLVSSITAHALDKALTGIASGKLSAQQGLSLIQVATNHYLGRR